MPKYLVPTHAIAEFLGNLDPNEEAIVRYRGYPHNDYLVTTDSSIVETEYRIDT